MDRLSEEELTGMLDRLFPGGLNGKDVWAELAPLIRIESSLEAVFHPGIERVVEEALWVYCRAMKAAANRPVTKEWQPIMEKVRMRYEDPPAEPQRELLELVGMCLWDVFADNHEVVAPDGRIADLGTFRVAGAWIADYLNRRSGKRVYDYLDFYLGSIWFCGRADLTPVYRLIFHRLRCHGYDWRYHPPALYPVDLRPHRRGGAGETDGRAGPALVPAYAGGNDGPPATVRAYQAVYGCSPGKAGANGPADVHR